MQANRYRTFYDYQLDKYVVVDNLYWKYNAKKIVAFKPTKGQASYLASKLNKQHKEREQQCKQ